jgi:acetamidase/formamidase
MPLRAFLLTGWLVAALSVPRSLAARQSGTARLGSTPDTVVRGHIPSNASPVLRVRPGQNVTIDALSHQGVNAPEGPAAFFEKAGIKREAVLNDAVEVAEKVKLPPDLGPHVLTGPIFVEGAEPGDLLEVRILNVEFRVPYGVNASNKGTGVLPDLLSGPMARVIQLDLKRNVALFKPGIEIPLAPFMGIMAVAPPPSDSMISSRPPGSFGGNLDLRHLIKGSTLYLPVYNPGALFYTGDSHAAQGDGEVDGTAIEISLRPTLQFHVHKGKGKDALPRAETATHYIAIGMDRDLNLALKGAVQEAVRFLMREKELTTEDAYSLASLGVDFRIAEAVNIVQVVYGLIPKSLFKRNPAYWYKP